MVDRKTTIAIADLFEQRLKQIEIDKRRSTETPVPPPTASEKVAYHVIEKDGLPTAIVELQGRKVLRTIEPDSDEGKRILEQSLQTRSINVKSVLSSRVQEASDPAVEQLFARAQEVAAVCGPFNPQELVPERKGTLRPEPSPKFSWVTNQPLRQAVLSRLATQCTIQTHEEKVHWLLSRDNRNLILRRLKDEGRLNEVLDGLLPPTDRFGTMLRLLLRHGAELSLTDLDREDLVALAAAMETTLDVGLPQPDMAEVRNLMGIDEFLAEYDVLLEKGFVGRQQELSLLQAFIANSDPPPHSQGWTGQVLTGLGGSGKSTLLAKFAHDIFKEQKATIAILDFDRPGISANDPYWLEQEICRQVGHQYPETAEFLRRRRREERSFRGLSVDTVVQSSPDAAEDERASRSIIFSVREALEQVHAENRPFLLVLDTFEQVEERDTSARVLEWLRNLGTTLDPTKLKVIFSGRLYESHQALLERQSHVQSIELGELQPPDAAELLSRHGVPEATVLRLINSDVLPRRPLELTLLAKMTTDLDKTIDELEKELTEGGEAAKELFAGLVYRRVLRRLGDGVAQELAYPGLVLRYVTVELIQEVLVPALEIAPLDAVEAARALDALASCGWLVYRRNGEVWHRSDLRRSTLKAMIAKEPEKAARISKQAVSFFEARTDERDRAEAIYHQLMLMREPADGDSFELGELKRANQLIGGNASDLPPAAATLMKFAVNGSVTAAEVESLPKRYLDAAYLEAGKQLVQSRQFGKAMRLFARRGATAGSSLDGWEVDTLFATVSWDRLTEPVATGMVTQRPTLQSITEVLYPRAILSPEAFSSYPFNQTLREATRDERLMQREMIGPEGHERLRRLVISLICRAAEDFVDTDKESIHRLASEVGKLTQPVSPVTARRFALLDRALSGSASRSTLSFSMRTIKLDSLWLNSLRDYLTIVINKFELPTNLETLLDDVQNVLKKDTAGMTGRRLLADVDSLSTEEGERRNIPLEVNTDNTSTEEALRYFRGPDPEFRDPCRFALLEAFPDRSARCELSGIISSVLPFKVVDLEPETFADALTADPESALEIYVELVDRAWSLGNLVRAAIKNRSSRTLDQVLSAYTRWDDAMNKTIVRGFSPIAPSSSHTMQTS
jgi:AAA ATPase-like protein